MLQPLVAVSTDVRHVDNYTWHAAPQQYLEAAISLPVSSRCWCRLSATGSTSTSFWTRSMASC